MSSKLIRLLKKEIKKYEALNESLRSELALLSAIRATQEEEEKKGDDNREKEEVGR